jgi:hypothetical protein
MTAVKIIEVLGTSEESWEDAASRALAEATRSVDDIHGIEVTDMTADVIDGAIVQYKTTCRIAFPVHEPSTEAEAGIASRVKKSASRVRPS